MRSFLAASDAAEECLAPIRAVTVEEFEGLEDPEILSAQEEQGTITVSFGFELLTVVWTVEVAYADYRANAAAFEEHFMNIETKGETTRMETMQRCYFEADLTLNQLAGEFTSVSIALAGVKRFTKRQ
ncbi:hypothetical protein XB05_19325 [Xanthomonas arboricola]|nr:hypothetical protein XB05_19325 [Xanthomonas arboricola]